jgi:hypothetical protein
MKNLFSYLTIPMMVFVIASCSNNEEPQLNAVSETTEFEVITMSDSPISRSNEDSSITQILKFKDKAAFERTLSKVKAMDDSSKHAFFNEIGFDGAYILLDNADEELDHAFDLAEATDSITGVKIIRDCVAKYDGILKFSDSDLSDVTPSLPFSDEKAELLGNFEGRVMIGNQIVSPQAAPAPAYDGSFIKYKAEVTVKNDHYTSYCRLGRMGQNMAIELETYKRIFGFKKSDKKCCYDGDLEIWSNGKSEKTRIHNAKGAWKLFSLASAYSPRVNMKMTNFSSTRNSNNKVSKTIENIPVK